VILLAGLDIFGSGKESKKRSYINKAIKYKLWEKQKKRCAICHKPIDPTNWHLDHKKPIALGGTNNIRNLQLLCPSCHDKKSREDVMKIARARRGQKKKESSLDIWGLGDLVTKKKRKKEKTLLDIVLS